LISRDATVSTAPVPKHIVIVMDGNGRWAQARGMPRVAGHKKGVDAVRSTLQACAKAGVSYLTVFAFSSENWRRPVEEVGFLMKLFLTALEREVSQLNSNNVRLRVAGEVEAFDPPLRAMILKAQNSTAANTGLCLTIAANYGGQWDIAQATKKVFAHQPELAMQLKNNFCAISETQLAQLIEPQLALAHTPNPDLFIRTGGEKRISNFLLWQLAYTELYFTDVYWPDFDEAQLQLALLAYASRERRFGMTTAQVQSDVPPLEQEDSCLKPAS
jgi:undecaprenyl diphosphate synthase